MIQYVNYIQLLISTSDDPPQKMVATDRSVAGEATSSLRTVQKSPLWGPRGTSGRLNR